MDARTSPNYEIEIEQPSAARCECCGGVTVRLTRFVYRDETPFAIYYAQYYNSESHNEIAMLISIGEWEDETDPSTRSAFYCRIRPFDDSYQVMLDDAATSPWGEVELVGQKLSRPDALASEWKDTVFEIVDAAFELDPSLRGFLARVDAGDVAMPLERGFGVPDELVALVREDSDRVNVNDHSAILDGTRHFLRCLLPIDNESYGTWCVGLWIEVAKADYDRVLEVWDDPEAYVQLRFKGVSANDLQESVGLPLATGASVELHAPDPDQPPHIRLTAEGDLAAKARELQSRDSFEAYALAQGLL